MRVSYVLWQRTLSDIKAQLFWWGHLCPILLFNSDRSQRQLTLMWHRVSVLIRKRPGEVPKGSFQVTSRKTSLSAEASLLIWRSASQQRRQARGTQANAVACVVSVLIIFSKVPALLVSATQGPGLTVTCTIARKFCQWIDSSINWHQLSIWSAEGPTSTCHTY